MAQPARRRRVAAGLGLNLKTDPLTRYASLIVRLAKATFLTLFPAQRIGTRLERDRQQKRLCHNLRRRCTLPGW